MSVQLEAVYLEALLYILFMTSRRRNAAGIVHANTFFIFGGYDNYFGHLSTTEMVTEEGEVAPGKAMKSSPLLKPFCGSEF